MGRTRSFIAVLPYDLHVQDEGCDPVTFRWGGARVRGYWPFSDKASGRRTLPSLPTHRIPFGPTANRRQPQLLLLAPEVREPASVKFANALRIDLFTETPREDDDLARTAESVLRSMLRAIRYVTGQWWIGHPHRAGEGLIRSSFMTDTEGNIVDRAVSVTVRVDARFGSERTLTAEMFQVVLPALDGVPFQQRHRDIFFDGVYYFVARDDIPRAVVNAVLALEMAIEGGVGRLAASRGHSFEEMRRVLVGGDLLANIAKSLPRLITRDFPTECPEDFQCIKQLWKTRGDLAHGRLEDGVREYRAPTRQEADRMLKSAGHFIDWLERAVPPA